MLPAWLGREVETPSSSHLKDKYPFSALFKNLNVLINFIEL